MADIVTVNPASGQQLATYPAFDTARIETVLGNASAARERWASVALKHAGTVTGTALVLAFHDQVEGSVSRGARIRTGGTTPPGDGFWCAPTVLDEAVAIARANAFGLAAAIWGADTDWALPLGRPMASRSVFIDAVAPSDPRLPFGGIRHTGYGRELSEQGLREFANSGAYSVNAHPGA